MENQSVRELDLLKIQPNLRIVSEIKDIEALSRSIRSEGLKEPICVWFDGERFRILDGEKRWRACHRLGISRIKAFIVGLVGSENSHSDY